MSEDETPEIKTISLPPSEAATLSVEIDSTDAGTEEAKLLSRGLSESELKKEAAAREHHRSENFRDHFECVAIAGLYVIAFLVLVVGLSWFWHLLTPECWHYLGPDQISKLQNIVTGGVLVGVAAEHFRRRLGPSA